MFWVITKVKVKVSFCGEITGEGEKRLGIREQRWLTAVGGGRGMNSRKNNGCKAGPPSQVFHQRASQGDYILVPPTLK